MNVTNVLFCNYIDSSTGYAFTFGGGDKMDSVYTFAATSTSIVKGIMHERCTTAAFICYTCLVSGFHLSGCVLLGAIRQWLAQRSKGFERTSFAGSGSIHSLAGSASFAAAYMAGPRHDRFENDGKINDIPLHSIPQAFLGSFFFVLGMLAFNTDYRIDLLQNEGDGIAVAKVAVNTGWNFEVGLNGSFIGMIIICVGCNQYQKWAALVVGILIDDPVGGLGGQMGGGFFYLVFVALFKDDGVFLQPSLTSANVLLINTVGGITIMIWAAGTMVLIYIVLRYFKLHRVSLSDEKIGLDEDEVVNKQPAYRSEDVLECQNEYMRLVT
uniref:Ammonium transporter AmtB-like domain-containing protein n=1 Tax=Daphnia galeata TaxID=27404 RepID=A0A8J2RME9_9CRUS|nr:unnamed protein product [Daphnia galeata]